ARTSGSLSIQDVGHVVQGGIGCAAMAVFIRAVTLIIENTLGQKDISQMILLTLGGMGSVAGLPLLYSGITDWMALLGAGVLAAALAGFIADTSGRGPRTDGGESPGGADNNAGGADHVDAAD